MKARVRDASFIAARVEVSGSGCWNWTGSLNVAGRAIYNNTYAYRIAYEVLVGPLNGMQVNHHCDNPRCVNPDHLYAGTQRENIDDATRRGRMQVPKSSRGEQHYAAYPDALVDALRERYRAGELQKDLAAETGISLATIRKWMSGGARGRAPIRRIDKLRSAA